MQLIKDGKIVSAVLYSHKADTVDKTAVGEYCLFLHYCTECDPHAYRVLPSAFTEFVCLGTENEFARYFGIDVPKEKFKDDTVYIRVKGNVVVLDGGKRGKLYAVYEFLERFLGVRFYSPQDYKTPHIENLEIPDCEIIYTPPIRFRELYAYDLRWDNAFSARLRNNSENYPLGLDAYGGSLMWAFPKSHTTLTRLMPPEDKKNGFAAHPEYYAYRKDKGCRVCRHHTEFGFPWGEGEICWTNPKVRKLLVEKMKQWILDEPDMEIFSLSQSDYLEHCECEECEALAIKHGLNGEPRWSAPIIDAVNHVAREIRKWQKNDGRVKGRIIYIETFAYHYATDAPIDLPVENNVLIRFCGAHKCNFHRMDEECKSNELLRKAFEEWNKIAKNIYVWTYPNNHCMSIAYNSELRVYQNHVQYYADKGIWGIFAQFDNTRYRGVGPWWEVRQYLYAKILWDPYLDFDKEYREAMEFFYGDAAPYLMEVERRYIESLEEYDNKCKKEKNNPGLHLPVAYTILPEYYSEEFIQAAENLFEIALSKVDTQKLQYRVRREYAYLKFIKMYLHKGVNYDEMQKVLDEFDSLGIEFENVERFREHFFGGRKDDLFLPEIEDRNREALREKLMAIARS